MTDAMARAELIIKFINEPISGTPTEMARFELDFVVKQIEAAEEAAIEDFAERQEPLRMEEVAYWKKQSWNAAGAGRVKPKRFRHRNVEQIARIIYRRVSWFNGRSTDYVTVRAECLDAAEAICRPKRKRRKAK